MDLANIKLQGNASIVGNYIRLTKNKLFLSGQAFHSQPVSGNFETEFTFRIGTSVEVWCQGGSEARVKFA